MRFLPFFWLTSPLQPAHYLFLWTATPSLSPKETHLSRHLVCRGHAACLGVPLGHLWLVLALGLARASSILPLSEQNERGSCDDGQRTDNGPNSNTSNGACRQSVGGRAGRHRAGGCRSGRSGRRGNRRVKVVSRYIEARDRDTKVRCLDKVLFQGQFGDVARDGQQIKLTISAQA